VAEIRSNIVELRGLLDDAERRLTDEGVSAPAVVFGQSFLIIFREGLEAVLLVTVLLGYLEAAKATQYRRPILWGMAAAVVATAFTFVVLRTVLAAIPVGREILEAVTALLAVVVLFYVSFWLIARLEQKRWMEFLRARVWNAVSVGSTSALMLVGFTAVYREGFETALFYQALMTFGAGLGVWVAAGLGAGLVALAAVSWLIFKLGRRLPVRAFLSTAVGLLMATSVAFVGNAVRALQEADVLGLHRWPSWPRPPIFLSQALGYWPSRETLAAQAGLTAIYIAGALYMFVLRPRLRGGVSAPAASASDAEQRVPVDVAG
jgi:high-affinity iron transporter